MPGLGLGVCGAIGGLGLRAIRLVAERWRLGRGGSARKTAGQLIAEGRAAAAKAPAAKKPPATTKTGRLRASAVRVIKPADR